GRSRLPMGAAGPRPASDQPLAKARRQAGKEAQHDGKARNDRRPEEREVGRRHEEGVDDPVGADGKMAGAPGPAAQERAPGAWSALPQPDEGGDAHDGKPQPVDRRPGAARKPP